MSGVWQGVRDRRRWSVRARVDKPSAKRVNEYGDRLGGSAKRKRRGRRSSVARCVVPVGEHWETQAGAVVVDPTPEQILKGGLVQVVHLCGFSLKARRGAASCPAHGSRTRV